MKSALHLFALTAFAIAQPLYDLIGRHAHFLVAHDAGPLAIGALVFVLSVGIPLALVALEWAAGRIHSRAGAHLHTVFVAILVALFLAGLLARAPLRPAAAVAIAGAGGIAGAWTYRRWQPARTFLSILSPAAIVFAAVFLVATPVSRLLFPGAVPAEGRRFAAGSPVVLVIFDELSTFALLDAEGRLDRDRYPSFAALADDAWWFRNTTATSSDTDKALPAILTGRFPRAEAKLLPIAADHPRNLFTWMAGSYQLHVSESVTAMCPRAICEDGTRRGDRRLDGFTLASDVAVLYLHLVVPEEAAARLLPPLSGTWTGFARAGSNRPADFERTDLDISQRFSQSVQTGRAARFREFISGIRAQDGPALHFVHAALPHQPYHYLPSGQEYGPVGLAQGLLAIGQWSGHDALVVTGHRQYLQQVELVDRLLGELIARLKGEGLYDRSLVIVTSDHGAAFQPGRAYRALVDDSVYKDIAAVPLFVKLPGQRAAQVSDRQVSGVDLVPTVAGVIGADVPWDSDGAPIFGVQFPERALLAYRDSSGHPLKTFDAIAAARDPDRQRRLQAALSNVAVEGYDSIVGAGVDTLNVSTAPSEFEVVSESFAAFADVDPSSRFLPALVRGYIAGTGMPLSFDVAVAVNGVVRAVTRTSAWDPADRYFAALVPAESFERGANTLEVLALEGGASPAIRALRFRRSDRTTFAEDGSARLQVRIADGTRLRIASDLQGWVDVAEEPAGAGIVRLRGWAADTGAKRGVKSIVAFAGSTEVASTVPDLERPDVSAAMGLPAGIRTAFTLDIPVERLHRGPITVLGVSAGQTAAALKMQPAAAATLRRLQSAR